ncbi:hypothetical protein KIL84_018445 [Mauremys mutica]|uniref:Uncharacterized protein n=1 Tax=Mauremys mutica TaxID=74926 RepID=A0A9D3XT51_9SAUR|nr:hypothetical protein KIL84_018445 [Mauremys mutica]
MKPMVFSGSRIKGSVRVKKKSMLGWIIHRMYDTDFEYPLPLPPKPGMCERRQDWLHYVRYFFQTMSSHNHNVKYYSKQGVKASKICMKISAQQGFHCFKFDHCHYLYYFIYNIF